MICVKFTAFCDLRIRLATLRKSVRKFWFCKLAFTCADLRVRLHGQGFRRVSIMKYHQFARSCIARSFPLQNSRIYILPLALTITKS